MRADDAPTVANYISSFTGGGTGSLSAVANGNTVTVTGTLTDVTQTLSLNLDSDVTVKCNADISTYVVPPNDNSNSLSNMNSVINVTGGTFDVVGGSILMQKSFYQFQSYPSSLYAIIGETINVSDGIVSVTSGIMASMSGMTTITAKKVTVSGGIVNMSSDRSSAIGADTVIVGGTGKVQAAMGAIGASYVEVKDNAQVTSSNIYHFAYTIFGREVKVSGGIVSSTSKCAISCSNITVSGGLVYAFSDSITGILADGLSGSWNGVISGSDFTGATGTGVVIGINNKSNQYYMQGSSEDILWSPASATVKWDKSGISNGISYANGTNTGFIPLSVTLYSLELSSDMLNFVSTGEQKTFTITSNTDWTVSSSASWLMVSPASGSNDSTITVTAAANTATTQRTATITVSGTGVTAQTISVTQAAAIPVTAVALNYSTESLTVGDTLQLTAKITPDNAANQSLRWSSSDTSIAAVSDSGLVTAKAAGTAVIIVTTVDGGFTASCTLTVNPPAVAVTGIKLNTASATILVGDTFRLTATVEPANATNKSLRWSSSAETVATVSSTGLVTGKAAGTALIIATTVDGGFPAMCNVEVQPLSVEIPDSTQTIGANGKGTINLSLTIPSNATVTGSFLIQFPDGITLDEQLTVLSAQLSGNFSLSFTAEANNTWLITIKSNGLKSATETPAYTKIMDIAYKASGGIEKGTYEATIKNLDFTTNDGVPIQKDLIPVTINVSQTITAIENISNSSFYAYITNNTLKVESPQAEKITIYSASGVLLYSAMKSAGEIDIPVSSLHGSIYIIKGSVSGTIKVTK